MARYNYVCLSCKLLAESIKGSQLNSDEEWEVIYETEHPMQPTSAQLIAALICPRCGSGSAQQTLKGCDVICYIRGNGYLDKAGCHRDMNLHCLETNDPYSDMREPGEAADLKLRLQRAGYRNSHIKHFVGDITEKDVIKIQDRNQ